ncbi:GerAB/ArcD/ProY family transporter [Geobacillus thermodenitrificans]|uniref:GerAB/ArcD/ProY family transporter n=1 Tax=Geobacillus thermodenitrificans TaxID=33940 RepID=UPI00399CD890
MGAMVFVCAVAVRSGIAVLGRLAQILVPVVILLLTIIVILVFPDIELENMFPMFENRLLPSIMGTAAPQKLLMAFLLPHVIDEDRGQKWGNITVILIMLTLFVANVMTLFVLGNITGDFVYPVMNAVHYISIADLFRARRGDCHEVWGGDENFHLLLCPCISNSSVANYLSASAACFFAQAYIVALFHLVGE